MAEIICALQSRYCRAHSYLTDTYIQLARIKVPYMVASSTSLDCCGTQDWLAILHSLVKDDQRIQISVRLVFAGFISETKIRNSLNLRLLYAREW